MDGIVFPGLVDGTLGGVQVRPGMMADDPVGLWTPASGRVFEVPRVGSAMGKRSSDETADPEPGDQDPQKNATAKNAKAMIGSARKGRKKSKQDTMPNAFDIWLQRELQDMFSGVVQEPIPDELMQLIEQAKAEKK